MKPSLRLVGSLFALAMLVGCGKPSPEDQKKAEEQAAALASAMLTSASAVPTGSKILSDDAFGTTYSYMVDDLNEIGVSVASAVGVTNLKTAVQDATLLGDKKEVDKTTYQIATAPQAGGTVFIYEYKKVKAGWVKAQCDGPGSYKDKLVEICSSLAPK